MDIQTKAVEIGYEIARLRRDAEHTAPQDLWERLEAIDAAITELNTVIDAYAVAQVSADA